MLLDNIDALPGARGLPQRRILIVEDEFIIAMAAEEALRSVGHEVIGPVTTCEDAIRCAEQSRPDLVVMDTTMPRGNACCGFSPTSGPVAVMRSAPCASIS